MTSDMRPVDAEVDLKYPGLVVGSERELKLKRFIEENELPAILTASDEVLVVDPEAEAALMIMHLDKQVEEIGVPESVRGSQE